MRTITLLQKLRGLRPSPLLLGGLCIAFLVALPVVGIGANLFQGGTSAALEHLAATVLPGIPKTGVPSQSQKPSGPPGFCFTFQKTSRAPKPPRTALMKS